MAGEKGEPVAISQSLTGKFLNPENLL